MSIEQIKFFGLITNKTWEDITGPEFMNALTRCGWQEGTGTHFFKRMRKRGRAMGIPTPAHLEREIAHGHSAPASRERPSTGFATATSASSTTRRPVR